MLKRTFNLLVCHKIAIRKIFLFPVFIFELLKNWKKEDYI
jgi:anaerobic ribonucleoside-triphosphate reductase